MPPVSRAARVIVLLAVFAVAARLEAEMPVSSDSIVDSIGVNVHLHYTDTPYANFSLVSKLLTELGVRHIRDGIVDTTWDEFYKRHNALGKLGIHCVYVTSPKQTDALLATYPNRVRGDFEGYEAPNEYNNSGDAHWPETLKAFLPKLDRITKDSPVNGGHSIVIGPSLTRPDAYEKLAGVQQYFDFANMHNYPGGRNPGTAGWGGGGYGSIDWNMRLVRGAWQGKPVMTTEIGYTTDPENKQSIPEDVEGKYLPRLILEQLDHNVNRTYIYELIDVGPKVSKNDAAFGLVRHDGSAKPAYVALQSLIGLTADPGARPKLVNLDYQLSGNTSGVHHLLAQRSDGSYLFLYWVEQPSFDQNSRKPQPVEPRALTFSSPQRIHSAEVIEFSSNGTTSKRELSPGSSIRLTASDTLSVLRLKPASSR